MLQKQEVIRSMKTLTLYAGLDVAQEFTIATVVDEMGNPVRELKVPTNEQGYKQLFYDLHLSQF